ncbi:hypothetical protein GCK32_000164 [Trichostrongylus colubriformis]|uniref:Uncharacterized protein n=1 Tax=Trichostrongylus colubriformis TaxID=6319 RepID=A0AAN8G9Y4_TRICO
MHGILGGDEFTVLGPLSRARDHTVQVGDVENLSLYMRKKIRQYCLENQLACPEITVKNGYLSIRSNHMSEPLKIKSTILAVKIGWQYSGWSGLPIKELLTEHEVKEYEDGRLEWGSVTVESLIKLDKPNSSLSMERTNRKREAVTTESLPSKVPRKEGDNCDNKE